MAVVQGGEMTGRRALEARSFSHAFARLGRYTGLMAAVFVLVFGIGLLAAFYSPQTYTANASLLMQLGSNYVFDPAGSDGSRASVASIDEVVQSEVEILNSAELKRRVLAQVGLKAVLSDTPKLWSPITAVDKARAEAAGLKALSDGFVSGSVPGSNVVRLSFKHKDATTAALILNNWIDAYQAYRREVFRDRLGPALEGQRQAFGERLGEADSALQDFLDRNGLVDFDSARQTYTKLYEQAMSERFTLDGSIAQSNARLRAVNARLGTLTPEISVQRDLDLSVPAKILSLRQQRQELLARYQPDAAPVTDLDAQIASLETMMASGGGVGEKDHRMGVNPIYQDVLTQKLNLEADLAALSGRRAQLAAQSADIGDKLKNLLRLEAEYSGLSGERQALQKTLGQFIDRSQTNAATSAVARGADEGVRVVDVARPPEKPQSLRRPLLILGFLAAVITALCAGLARAMLRPGVPGPKATSEALGLPILAQAPLKA